MRYITGWLGGTGIKNAYVVVDTHSTKLTSLNLFTEEEARIEAARQNEAHAVKAHWPEPDDAELLAVLHGPEFNVGASETAAFARFRVEEEIARKRAGL